MSSKSLLWCLRQECCLGTAPAVPILGGWERRSTRGFLGVSGETALGQTSISELQLP